MHLTVYIIDDSQAKADMLPKFLEWLHTNFQGVTFSAGFSDPIRDSANPTLIFAALSDPNGIVLLDLWLPGDTRGEAADTLLQLAGVDVNERDQVWAILRRTSAAKLCASILVVANVLSSRIVWITSQGTATYLYPQMKHLPQQYPHPPWPDNADGIFWDESHANDLAPLVERTVRQPYLDAEKEWQVVYEGVRAPDWIMDDSTMTPLFPDRRMEHDVFGHSKSCRDANAARTGNLLAPLFKILNVGLPDVEGRLYLLKGISRGGKIGLTECKGTQICVSIVLAVLKTPGPVAGHWTACFEQASPGAVLLALSTLASVDNPPTVLVSLEDPQLSITLTFKYGDPRVASEACSTFQLRPRERMIRDRRDTAGTIVLALDYLKPFEIEKHGTTVTLRIKRKVNPMS